MAAVDKDVTKKEPYHPAKGAPFKITIDVQDLSRKIKHGPGAILAETVMNLCLLYYDQVTQGKARKPEKADK